MRHRRRAERMRQTSSAASQQRTRRERERRQQRLVYIGAAVAGMLLVAFLIAGFYLSIYRPPRKVVAQVGEVPIQLRDVATEGRLLQGLGLVAAPHQVLNLLIRNEVLRQQGVLDFAATVDRSEIEQRLADSFEVVSDPDAPPPTSLSPEGRQRYEEFLRIVDIDDGTYRAYVEGELILEKSQAYVNAQVESPQEQVFLHWMVADSDEEANELLQRLEQGDDFATVAQELERSIPLASEEGEVGWVPREALPDLDESIFSAEIDSILGPLATLYGPVVAKVTAGPEAQPVSDAMREILGSTGLDEWLLNQINAMLTVYEFGQDEVNWVASRLADSATAPGGTGG